MSESLARAKAKYYQNNKEKCKQQIKKAKMAFFENNMEICKERNRTYAKTHYYTKKEREYVEMTVRYIRYLFKK